MIRFLLLALLLVVVGCDSSEPAAISNVEVNDITDREKLVSTFGTAEVTGIPTHSSQWLVRDTNGVIWYVSTRSTCGRTRMFGWHEEFPKPEPPPTVFVTNAVTITNTVTLTNYIIEDPAAK